MRRFRSHSARKFWWLLLAVIALLETNVAMAHSLQRPTALQGSIEMLGAVLVALLIVRFPRQIVRWVAAMRRERALFRSMATNSRQAAFVCEPIYGVGGTIFDFSILYTNKRASHLFGPNGSHSGNHAKTLTESIRHSDAASAIHVLIRVLRTGESEIATLPFAGRDTGHGIRSCEMHVVAQSGCLVLTTLQSPEEQAARRKVEELHDFTRAVFENAPTAIIATDTAGVIIAMNSEAERLTQFPKHDLVGKHSLLYLHEPKELSQRTVTLCRELGRPLGKLEILTHNRQHKDREDWTYVCRDGSHVCVHLTVTPLHTDGGISGYLAVAFDVTERKELADTAFHMARHDGLTGLPNRTLVRPTIEAALERAHEDNSVVAVFALDLDNFKRMNDSLGHAGGDSVLTTTATRIRACLHSEDFAARLGGDEFVIVFPNIVSASNARTHARNLLDTISQPFFVGQREVLITTSIGYCLSSEYPGTSDDLLRRADLAMYSSKTAGRGRFSPFSHDLQKTAHNRMEMEEDLRYALLHREFTLHYQPQVTCTSGNVESLEMLLRWNSPRHGNVPPDVFVPIALEAGLMSEIGAWSLKQACKDCTAAQVQLNRRLRVAVNLSPQQLQPELFDFVQEALQSSGLPPGDLELELTEQVMINSTPCVLETLDRIRRLGVTFAIDDFGTGFSSFAYILKYQVDRLKIDRSFVSRVTNDTNAAAIVRTVIAMAHNLGLRVCAEGAETEEQADFLFRRRCDEIQGYLFAKPVPFRELESTIQLIEQPSRRHSRATVSARRNLNHDLLPSTPTQPIQASSSLPV